MCQASFRSVSIDTSRRISAGEDHEHWETEEYDAAFGAASSADFLENDEPTATKQQMASIEKLCQLLGRQSPAELSFEAANSRLFSHASSTIVILRGLLITSSHAAQRKRPGHVQRLVMQRILTPTVLRLVERNTHDN
jgi:hypothetical protein